MKTEIKILFLITLGLSLLALLLAYLESRFRTVTQLSGYIVAFGPFWFTVFSILSIVAVGVLFFTFGKRSLASRSILAGVAIFSTLALLAPETTKSVIAYFGSHQRRARYVNRVENELKQQAKFSTIELSYRAPPNAQFEHLSIHGDVATELDYDELVENVESKLDMSIFWSVRVGGVLRRE